MKRRHFTALALLASTLGSSGLAQAQTTASAATKPAAPKKSAPVILVVGDSLAPNTGSSAAPAGSRCWSNSSRPRNNRTEVLNASISGDTTSGGRSRLPALLKQHQPAIVIIELGGNDALRGLPLNMTRDNLATMARQSREAGAQVLLLGMEMPPNYGAKYGQEFREVYTSVAREQQTALLPFFLKDVGDLADPTKLFQADRIHPNESAQPIMMGNVWPELKKLL